MSIAWPSYVPAPSAGTGPPPRPARCRGGRRRRGPSSPGRGSSRARGTHPGSGSGPARRARTSRGARRRARQGRDGREAGRDVRRQRGVARGPSVHLHGSGPGARSRAGPRRRRGYFRPMFRPGAGHGHSGRPVGGPWGSIRRHVQSRPLRASVAAPPDEGLGGTAPAAAIASARPNDPAAGRPAWPGVRSPVDPGPFEPDARRPSAIHGRRRVARATRSRPTACHRAGPRVRLTGDPATTRSPWAPPRSST